MIVTAEVNVDAGLITLFGDFSDEFGEKPLVVTLNGVELDLLDGGSLVMRSWRNCPSISSLGLIGWRCAW